MVISFISVFSKDVYQTQCSRAARTRCNGKTPCANVSVILVNHEDTILIIISAPIEVVIASTQLVDEAEQGDARNIPIAKDIKNNHPQMSFVS